jgi:hypothetical protein
MIFWDFYGKQEIIKIYSEVDEHNIWTFIVRVMVSRIKYLSEAKKQRS